MSMNIQKGKYHWLQKLVDISMNKNKLYVSYAHTIDYGIEDSNCLLIWLAEQDA